jgi:hypothetical protein
MKQGKVREGDKDRNVMEESSESNNGNIATWLPELAPAVDVFVTEVHFM